MKKSALFCCLSLALAVPIFSHAHAQEKKLDRIRVGGGSTSATQMSMWLAKEGGFYEKHGLSVEAISIPGSSLALQAMLAGELPIIQIAGTTYGAGACIISRRIRPTARRAPKGGKVLRYAEAPAK
jgi:ABC-type nitrate/sulfonate/bicarbonate transport system substrate-binding protein